MRNAYRSVIFDFDYTLADSSPGVVECANYALRRMGYADADPERIRRTIGLSLPDTFVRLAGETQARRSREYVRHFTARADEVMAGMTSVFACAPDALRRLRKAGFGLGIVSTKYRYRIEDVLRRNELTGIVDVIVGGEDVAEHKPDPAGLRAAIGRLGAAAAETLYAGDSPVDAEAARRAGVDFAGVLSGKSVLRDFKPFPAVHFAPDAARMADWLLEQ
jgi:phosphoglycolate phosphatase